MVDCWTDEDYDKVLSFVEQYLWLFVQENAATHKPSQIICNLTQLNQRELRFLQIIYFLLSDPIQKSVKEATPRLLHRLSQSSDKMIAEIKGSIRGNVDWNLTLKRQLRTGFNDSTLFVTRLLIKTHNMPEVQALKYLLTQIKNLCVEILDGIPEPNEMLSSQPQQKWKEEIRLLYNLTHNFLKNTCLRNVELPAKITEMTLQKIRCARDKNFKIIYSSLKLYHKLLLKEEQETLRTCLHQVVLKPLNRDILYELYILFMTISSFDQAGWRQENLKLIGYDKGAIAQYKYSDETVRIYYQNMPEVFAQTSIYTNLMKKYNLNTRLRRPDIIFEFHKEFHKEKELFKLIEVKRSQSESYIRDSFYKVLGYLKDFEQCFTQAENPCAILILWKGITVVEGKSDVIQLVDSDNYQKYLNNLLKR